MSHRIIISNKAASTTELVTQNETISTIEYEITYTPSHDLTESQVGNQVERILKLAAKMNE